MANCVKDGGPILTAELLTPIGTLILQSCANGFHSIKPASKHYPLKENNPPTGSVQTQILTYYPLHPPDYDFETATTEREYFAARKNLDHQINWVRNYFQHPDTDGNLLQGYDDITFTQFCFDNDPTDFEVKVWKALFENITSGQTTSYSKLAQMTGHPKAARAVGTALKNNPVLLMIPCHRIIRSDGTLGKFSGGTWNNCKGFLQGHENRCEQ